MIDLKDLGTFDSVPEIVIDIVKANIVALENALLKLKEMRSEEGKKLAEDIQNRCDLLKNYIEDIEKYSYNVVIDYKEKLKNANFNCNTHVNIISSLLITKT